VTKRRLCSEVEKRPLLEMNKLEKKRLRMNEMELDIKMLRDEIPMLRDEIRMLKEEHQGELDDGMKKALRLSLIDLRLSLIDKDKFLQTTLNHSYKLETDLMALEDLLKLEEKKAATTSACRSLDITEMAIAAGRWIWRTSGSWLSESPLIQTDINLGRNSHLSGVRPVHHLFNAQSSRSLRHRIPTGMGED